MYDDDDNNLTYSGHVIDASKPVNTYGIHSNIDSMGYIRDASKPIDYDSSSDDLEDTNDNNYGFGGILAIIVAPFLLIMIIDKVFVVIADISRLIYVPFAIILILATLFLPKAKRLNASYTSVLEILNFISGFIVANVMIDSYLYKYMEFLMESMPSNVSFIFIILQMIGTFLMYIVRFLVLLFIMPLLQKCIWFVKDTIIKGFRG